MCGCCMLSEATVWCGVWRRQVLLSCYVCLCLCCLLSQVVAASGTIRPFSSSAPVVSGGVVAAERSPLVCEGELCGVSSPSVRQGWNRPCLSSLSPSPSVNGIQCFKLKLQQPFVTSVRQTTHAPHVSALIPCNTERYGLVTVQSVQEA